MSKRKKVAIFIDYSIRNPGFIKSFNLLKEYMFSDTFEEFEREGDLEIIDFWREEIKKPEIEDFYFKQKINFKESDLRKIDWKIFFYNETHYKKFLEDYSFNLYVEPNEICKKDIEIINIAQNLLVDIILIDEFEINRKKTNTLFFLSKIRINFKSLEFKHVSENFDETEYLAVWNPKKNFDQENANDLMQFQDWFYELEKIVK